MALEYVFVCLFRAQRLKLSRMKTCNDNVDAGGSQRSTHLGCELQMSKD